MDIWSDDYEVYTQMREDLVAAREEILNLKAQLEAQEREIATQRCQVCGVLEEGKS